MSRFKNLTYREDFDLAMEYLSKAETEHAPHFNMVAAPQQLRDLMYWAYMPRSEERSRYLNEFVDKSWAVPDGEAEVLLAKDHLNAIRYINRYLREANQKLKDGGYLVVAFDTAMKRRLQFYIKYRRFWANIFYSFDFIWHRVFPKLLLTRRFYYFCTKRERRVLPRPEVLGRLYYCGFEVVAEQYIHDRYCVIARKVQEPNEEQRHYGLIVKLKRIGKDGKLIWVYKFRTMYAYSEYLQTYVYDNNNLQVGGKFRDDYRITDWGRWLRKTWLDELPMFINIFKGHMRLVGVRPLSEQYFELYDPEVRERRIKYKPGMLPPFYADMPETLQEIQESEMRYFEAYDKHPFRTNWRYFWKIVGNMVFHHKRSQ
ncbi:MAG: sugar transferase [Bacteroidales bacterium]|nr:sugar transferase [Bacteroidales bacterium]